MLKFDTIQKKKQATKLKDTRVKHNQASFFSYLCYDHAFYAAEINLKNIS